MAGIYCHLICLSISHDKNDMANLFLRQPDFWVVASPAVFTDILAVFMTSDCRLCVSYIDYFFQNKSSLPRGII